MFGFRRWKKAKKSQVLTEKSVMDAVIEPELDRDLVTLEMVKDVQISGLEGLRGDFDGCLDDARFSDAPTTRVGVS